MLNACTPTAPEQAIRDAIARIEAGIENKDAGDVIAELTENFDGNGYIDRKGVHRLLIGQFLRHQNIAVLLSNVDIEISEPDQQRARMTATVVTTGAVGLIPDDGRLWRLEGQWEVIDGDWLLTRMNWE